MRSYRNVGLRDCCSAKIIAKTHLVAGDSGFDRFVLVLEVNCIKQPEPKPYLTTDNPQNICEEVTKTAFQKYDAFVVILSQMFGGYHICKIMVIIACMLFDT